MPNISQHVNAFGSVSLTDRPFDVLDGLALSQIVYMPMEGLPDGSTIGELWQFLHQTYPDGLDDVYQQKRYKLTEACAAQPRYRDWVIRDYRNDVDDVRITQFAACLFCLPGIRYAAFRGTDLTIAGWVEDLNMSYMTVPAQVSATDYIERAAKGNGDALYLGGHSKGGNLAVYAAAHANASTRERIHRVHSFDGPGVDEETLNSAAYLEISERIQSVIPQSSVVGMLLCFHPIYTVVRSDGLGILQHDAITWQIVDGAFVTLPDLDLQGRFTDAALRQWIDSLSMEDRRMLSGVVFEIVGSTKAETIDVIASDWIGSTRSMREAFRQLAPEVRLNVRRILKGLLAAGASEMFRFLLPRTIRVLNEPILSRLGTRKPDAADAPDEKASV